MKEDIKFNVYGSGGSSLNFEPMTWEELEKCPLDVGDTIIVISSENPQSNRDKRIKPPKVFDE